MQVSSELRSQIIKKLTHRRNGEEVLFVTSPIEVGAKLTFTKIGEAQVYNNNEWFPIEDNEGHRMSLSKVIYGRNLKFNSNKIEDRINAVIGAVEDKGLTLKVTNITEREVRDEKGEVQMADGKPVMTKVYHFNKELVG